MGTKGRPKPHFCHPGSKGKGATVVRKEPQEHIYKGVLEDMKFNVLIEKDEDGYFVAAVPSLPGCHTQAKSPDELTSRIKEAIEVYLDLKGCAGRDCIEIQVTDSEIPRSDEGR